jgi:hypothetical protein
MRAYKLRPNSATNRLVASCCNTAVLLTFDDSRHWANVYRDRVTGQVPPLQMRICTRHRPVGTTDTVPAFSGYPLRLLAKLAAARIAMLFAVLAK